MAQKPSLLSLSLTSNDHNSEWASAYLSHWIEECDAPRSPQLQCRRSSGGDGSHHRHRHRHDQMRRHCSHDGSQQSSPTSVNGSHLVSPVSRKSAPSDCITMVSCQSTAGAAHQDAAYHYDRTSSLSKRVHFHKGEGSSVSKSAPSTPQKSPRSRHHHKKLPKRGFPQLPFHPKSFDLGDIASAQDMIIEDDPSKSLQSVESLKIHDFAFGEIYYF